MFEMFAQVAENESWSDVLHSSLEGERVLFRFLTLNSTPSLLVACTFTAALCLLERCLSVAQSRSCVPLRSFRTTRLRIALFKTSIYWLVTLLRLLYMLIAMSMNIWLLLTTVTALACGQFFVEYQEATPDAKTRHLDRDYEALECEPSVKLPLVHTGPEFSLASPPLPRARAPYHAPSTGHAASPYRISDGTHGSDEESGDDGEVTAVSRSGSPTQRPRSNTKSKPREIFIHPSESNIARADAVAVELGIAGETERVRAVGIAAPPLGSSWSTGQGTEAARALLGRSQSRQYRI